MSDAAFMDVTVVIPAYNAARYLHSALGSVLAQTHQPAAVIVVDDGSSDATASIARGFAGIEVLDIPHQGAAAARNRGVASAATPYLAFLDADDLWLPTKLEEQMNFLQDHPEARGVFGFVRQFVSPELPSSVRCRYPVRPEPVPGRVGGTLLIEREAFQEVGDFDESLVGGDFIDWMLRAKKLGLALPLLESTLLLRRIHGANSGVTDRANIQRSYLDIVRAAHKGKC